MIRYNIAYMNYNELLLSLYREEIDLHFFSTSWDKRRTAGQTYFSLVYYTTYLVEPYTT